MVVNGPIPHKQGHEPKLTEREELLVLRALMVQELFFSHTLPSCRQFCMHSYVEGIETICQVGGQGSANKRWERI